ncbi:MAG: phospho-N-acetylmuramoyl-pentapeptide-transferase [Halobacteriovoraceae bacterium]|nr:phospho-N-acetylmuramoyl-pentapeptide-transferase [Halobacteriovoraceae bacterium]|tara:strand:+ start:7405 stop:8481 length:1077 start_codon:yes stop_codon:yes gene_type:complete
MFYHLLYPLSGDFAVFNVFRYITFRSFLAFVIAAVVSILWGRKFIAYMKVKQFGQAIREDGPQSHLKKRGTPTLGGIFIIGSVLFSCLFSGNYNSLPFIVTLLIMTSYFILGWIDDYLKVIKKNSDGVSAKVKLLWQFITALLACYFLVEYQVITTDLYIPFVKDAVFDLGFYYILFGAFVIVGSSNAVNLTDGLDGLVTGPIITSTATFAVLTYLSGHVELSNYLLIPYIAGSSELMVICAGILGASVGFLWYNCNPAEIFMGDVGSLSLGGALGAIAVISKNEFLFVIIGGIFVMEAISVILQVGSYKLRKKRIFKMAPLHHHFELLGWPEPKVIVRFWIISIVLSIFALATLKLR